MPIHASGFKTATTLALAALSLNVLVVVWSLSDGFFLVRSDAQQASARVAERMAGHLARGETDAEAVAARLADLAPPAATRLVLIDGNGARHAVSQTPPEAVDGAPAWYANLLVRDHLETAARLPNGAGQLVVTFDPAQLAARHWQALRVPWLAINVGMLLWVLVARLWSDHRVRRLVARRILEPDTSLLQERLGEKRPGGQADGEAGATPAGEPTLTKRLAEHSGAALLVINTDGLITYANAASARLFGYDGNDLLGKPASRLIPPWRQKELEEERARHAPAEMETQRLTRRGQLVDVLWHSAPIVGPNEEANGFVWSLWDITQRKREENVLRLLGRSASFFQEGVIITDAAQDNAVIYANEAVQRMTGHSPQELVGRFPRFLFTEEENPEGVAELKRALEEGKPCRVLLNTRRKDTSTFWNELSVAPISDATGRVTHFTGLMRDVTERHQHVQELMQDEARLRTVIDDAPLAICVTDADQVIRSVNPVFTRLFTTSSDHLIGHSLFELIPQEAWIRIRRGEGGSSAGGEISLTRRNGEALTILANTASLGNGDAQTVTFMVDITGRKRTEQALAEAKERAQVTLESIGDGVITTNASGVVDYLNPVAERLTGWVKEDVQGMPISDVFKLLDEETREPLKDPVERALRLGRMITINRRALLVSTDQHEFSLNITATPIRDREQRILGAVVVFRDVSETRAAERQISYQAKNDALTGLFNRREFQNRLEQALTSAREEKKTHALGYLDLDKFKIINDTCGHSAGDEVLKQVAALLQSKLRSIDTLARLGGDEFGMLLYSCSIEVAERIAEQIRESIAAYRFVWQDRVFALGVSIGLVQISAESGTLDEVLHTADTACYMAKNEGRNRVHVMRMEDAGAESPTASRWLQRIRDGIEQDRFVLFDRAARRLTADPAAPEYHEIQVRLHDEKGDLVGPASFMPIATRYHLLTRIDEWKVSTLLARIARTHPEGLVYGIGLSGQTLLETKFAGFVAEQLERSGADAGAICFEFDENDVLGNLTASSALMTELKRTGCHLAIANFGYGRASFAHIHNLPVDFLKIEGSVVQGLGNSPVDYVIAEAVSRVGQMMHMRIIATGVDDARTLDRLADLRIDYAQGNHIDLGRPLAD